MVRRVLVCAYEFADPVFSGNGTHCRVLLEGLLSVSPGVVIDVVCAHPSRGGCLETSMGINVFGCPVSMEKWRRLDVESDWRTFASESANRVNTDSAWASVRANVMANGYDRLLAIDWTGIRCLAAILGRVLGDDTKVAEELARKGIFLNFRVFGLSPTQADFYQYEESCALKACRVTAALSTYDCQTLLNHANSPQLQGKCVVLPCPVRESVLSASLHPSSPDALPNELLIAARAFPGLLEAIRDGERRFVVCCVRLSPEKAPFRFAEMANEFVKVGLTPLLLGSVGDEGYAKDVRAKLVRQCQGHCIILEGFVSGDELAAIFSCSLLNIHPCSYDAFALTITEAAACGCPTAILADVSGAIHVGATDLLGVGGYIEVLPSTEISTIVNDLHLISKVREVGRFRARSYNTIACGEKLLEICKL